MREKKKEEAKGDAETVERQNGALLFKMTNASRKARRPREHLLGVPAFRSRVPSVRSVQEHTHTRTDVHAESGWRKNGKKMFCWDFRAKHDDCQNIQNRSQLSWEESLKNWCFKCVPLNATNLWTFSHPKEREEPSLSLLSHCKTVKVPPTPTPFSSLCKSDTDTEWRDKVDPGIFCQPEVHVRGGIAAVSGSRVERTPFASKATVPTDANCVAV